MRAFCDICSELLDENRDVASTICGHTFHKICIKMWVKYSKSCPKCRHPAEEYQITKLFFSISPDDTPSKEYLENELNSLQAALHITNQELKLTKLKDDVMKSRLGFIKMDIMCQEHKIENTQLRFARALKAIQKLLSSMGDTLANLVNALKIVTSFCNTFSATQRCLELKLQLLEKELEKCKELLSESCHVGDAAAPEMTEQSQQGRISMPRSSNCVQYEGDVFNDSEISADFEGLDFYILKPLDSVSNVNARTDVFKTFEEVEALELAANKSHHKKENTVKREKRWRHVSRNVEDISGDNVTVSDNYVRSARDKRLHRNRAPVTADLVSLASSVSPIICEPKLPIICEPELPIICEPPTRKKSEINQNRSTDDEFWNTLSKMFAPEERFKICFLGDNDVDNDVDNDANSTDRL